MVESIGAGITHAARTVALAAALLLVLPVVGLTGVALSGPAGPMEAAEEMFTTPPGKETVAAREALPVPYMVVHPTSGVRQRLLDPVVFQEDDSDLPDFDNIDDVTTRKFEFFSYLKPMVEQENKRLIKIRRRLGFIRDFIRFHRRLDPVDQQWLASVVKEFRLSQTDPYDPDFWPALMRRVDSLPVDLVLVQAANESAWGTSRFAREGNNLFGQWCFRPGCGMIPSGRPDGATYEVAAFDSISESISSYMHNLNTGRVYRELRKIREKCRAEGRQPAATELAKGLTSYSERGMAYVTEIRAMLRHNAPVIAELGPS